MIDYEDSVQTVGPVECPKCFDFEEDVKVFSREVTLSVSHFKKITGCHVDGVHWQQGHKELSSEVVVTVQGEMVVAWTRTVTLKVSGDERVWDVVITFKFEEP